MASSHSGDVVSLLLDHGGEMRRDRLASRLHLRLAILDPILDGLEAEGKISITLGPERRTGKCWLVKMS